MILSGEAGIGKTRLAEEMVAWISRQGMATASAHCYAVEGRLAYAPVAAWLHEAGAPGRTQQEQRREEAVAIYAALGDIFAMTGRQQEARQVYQDGIASIPTRKSLPMPTDNATGVASLRLSEPDQRSIWQARLVRSPG